MKHIGYTMKDFIERNHLQKNIIAQSVGITPTYLSRIFEKETIDCKLFDKLCKAIGMRPSYFFEEEKNQFTGGIAASALAVAQPGMNRSEVEALKALLDEKERTIQILMRVKGFETGTKSGQDQ